MSTQRLTARAIGDMLIAWWGSDLTDTTVSIGHNELLGVFIRKIEYIAEMNRYKTRFIPIDAKMITACLSYNRLQADYGSICRFLEAWEEWYHSSHEELQWTPYIYCEARSKKARSIYSIARALFLFFTRFNKPGNKRGL
jgi:hypothetical protein